MFVNKAMQLAVLAAAMMWETRTGAATTTTPTIRLCGRKLSEIMSKVCIAYNDPTVVEQQTGPSRRKRQLGIADECCTYGCTWEQLNEYCAISKYSESPLAAMGKHTIADRSAEQSSEPESGAASVPAASGGAATRREVGRRSRGYGRARGRRCRCRRKRRSGRRRTSLMGNMALVRSVARAAPVVGTVSPLLTWGRTLNTDLPPVERDRYAYMAVYA